MFMTKRRIAIASVCLFALVLALSPATPTPAAAQSYVPNGYTLSEGWYPAEDGWLHLYWRGQYVGKLDPLLGRWQTTGRAHQVDLIAVAKPAPGPDAVAGDDPFPGGVDPQKVQGGPAYQINGRAASRDEVYRRLGPAGNGLVDDRGKWFLTAVLPEGERKKLLADLESSPHLQPWRAKLHVNAYAPDDWHVAQAGLAGGVTYQPPPNEQGRATVAFRLRAYAGPEVLAQALREADKSYAPDNDPDPTKPKPQPSPTPGPADEGTRLEVPDEAVDAGLGLVALLNLGLLALRRRLAG